MLHPPAVPLAVRLHRARPAAATHCVARRPLAPGAARFDRVVVHTERGRETLAELGVDAHVIPHPVYPSAAARADDGATLLALGVIRPYKGLADAIEVTRRLPDARLLVAGDPAMPLDGLRAAERVDWRLGFLSQAELDRALSETTRRASFPTARSSTSRARCSRRSGRACRPSSTTWRASASRCAPTAPAGSCRRATSRRSPRPSASCSPIPRALAAARAGAERARAELTWDASAAQHLALYRELG